MSLRFALAALLAVGSVITAAPTSGLSTSISHNETCITRIRSASTAPSSLPSSTRTSAQTVRTTVTIAGYASAATETITPAAITSTTVINATGLGSLTGTGAARTSTVLTTITQANATAGSGSCSKTKTVAADATTTVYTGSYNGTVAKRTAGVSDRQAGFLQVRQNPFESILTHLFGQAALAESRKPFEVDCLAQVTTYLIATSTESASALTVTVTASTPVVYTASTASGSEYASASSSGAVVTSTVTIHGASNGTSSGVCTVTTGKPTATTTQHLKCAPTNLISQVDGYGIGQTQGHANETQGLAPGSDPSACCQLCVDTEGCAAIEDDEGAGNCFLFYTTPSCGLGFTYAKGSKNMAAGAGFKVQTGCGTIEAASS